MASTLPLVNAFVYLPCISDIAYVAKQCLAVKIVLRARHLRKWLCLLLNWDIGLPKQAVRGEPTELPCYVCWLLQTKHCFSFL